MALIGLRDFVVAKVLQDDDEGVKYDDEIIKLKGAREVGLEPEIAEGVLYGDDQVLESETSISAYKVNIDLADLTLEEEAFLTGAKFENGVLKNNKDETPPEIAFGFKAPISSGKGFRLVWLLKGKAKPLSEEHKTKEDNIEFQTPKMELMFTPRSFDGEIKHKADSAGENGIDPEEFFTAEYLNSIETDKVPEV